MASGAWESIVINGRRFTCKADDDITFNLGGFKNEAIVQGDGSFTEKKERRGFFLIVAYYTNVMV